MRRHALSHLDDAALLRSLAALLAGDRSTTASMLAHLAEVEARGLHLRAAYPSLLAYCVGELRMSEDAACRRLRAARAARDFPVLLDALVAGRLHLSALVLLAPKLTADNVDELVAAASGKGRAEIETLLAERFPRADLPTRVESVGPPPALEIANKGPVTGPIPSAPARVNDRVSSRVEPLAPERYALQLTMGQELHDKLRHAQRLLGHVVRPGDVSAVLERALDALLEKLEKRKCGAASRSGRRRGSKNARHVPAHVREAVWARDGGRCTFVGDSGRRCESRERLEYDHVVPVARAHAAGGSREASVEGVRLLCRAHNQYEAERVYGAGFMEAKREAARKAKEEKRAEAERRRERARAEAEARREAEKARKAAESDPDTSVIPWLRSLGVRAEQAKRAAEAVAHLVDASLEERVKAAFAFHGSVRFPGMRKPPAGCAQAAPRAIIPAR